jgi:hypothetical protein
VKEDGGRGSADDFNTTVSRFFGVTMTKPNLSEGDQTKAKIVVFFASDKFFSLAKTTTVISQNNETSQTYNAGHDCNRPLSTLIAIPTMIQKEQMLVTEKCRSC